MEIKYNRVAGGFNPPAPTPPHTTPHKFFTQILQILVGPSKNSYYQAFNSQKGVFFMLKHTFLTLKTIL